jgi:hypothetical protein
MLDHFIFSGARSDARRCRIGLSYRLRTGLLPFPKRAHLRICGKATIKTGQNAFASDKPFVHSQIDLTTSKTLFEFCAGSIFRHRCDLGLKGPPVGSFGHTEESFRKVKSPKLGERIKKASQERGLRPSVIWGARCFRLRTFSALPVNHAAELVSSKGPRCGIRDGNSAR